ncbi:DUF397 domain-containing protein [Actinomadura montaniterrae]|uniref:DUF397 domain-containing protein n=1 Tax=Actinomadura montaniterrae TaxID=1803903 RepID=A0A6L3VYD2_9ACTN|nr:DUF397 domain-containing protein [Actinomadura montaniterrae]KAB2383635.1 DUF397 domain-containing protein [Actinomadura montaniterrae]
MTTWRKSSYSGQGGTGECIEVARLPEAIGIRDSRDSGGGHLRLSRSAFAALVGRLKRG